MFAVMQCVVQIRQQQLILVTSVWLVEMPLKPRGSFPEQAEEN